MDGQPGHPDKVATGVRGDSDFMRSRVQMHWSRRCFSPSLPVQLVLFVHMFIGTVFDQSRSAACGAHVAVQLPRVFGFSELASAFLAFAAKLGLEINEEFSGTTATA